MNNDESYLYELGKFLVKWFYIKPLYNPKIIGLENIPENNPVVLAGNHINNIDPLLVCVSQKRNVHFLAKKELYKYKLLKYFLLKIGTIPFDRDKATDVRAIGESLKKLKKGQVIGIFPEGKRNKTIEDLLPFKEGPVRLAKKTNASLIPFAIIGNYKAFKSNITLVYGNPLDVDNLSIDEGNKLLEENVKKLKKFYNM